jgi:glucose-6-phosphate isomerase, archaeal
MMTILGRAMGDRVDWQSGRMDGAGVQRSVKTVGELAGVFADEAARSGMDAARVVYAVEWTEPVAAGTEGGLFWGATRLEAGCVGDEYFMTRGHFHAVRDRGEFYGTVSGEGMLVLMEEDGATRVERMVPGSLHYIPGRVAHRTVNTGAEAMVFWACWPSDAGHDYAAIAARGFGLRVMRGDGSPRVVEA